MFCSEPIEEILFGFDEYRGPRMRLPFWRDPLELHIDPNGKDRMVLLTVNHAISLDAHGVTKESRDSFCKREGEDFETGVVAGEQDAGEISWIYYEHTLFVGETLKSVTPQADRTLLEFTDFDLYLIPDKNTEMHRRDIDAEDSRVYGVDRLLLRKCDCGAQPHVYIDFADDFEVRCCKCGAGTYASMWAANAIDDWNNGVLAN